MKIEDLKKEYDNLDICTIENHAANCREHSRQQEKAFILRLFYLESTKRFRENPAFRKATWADYLQRKWNMSVNQYMKLRMAWIAYEEFSEQHGPGTVAKVVQECGAKKTPEVIKAIQKEAPQAPIKQEALQKIIEKHREPVIQRSNTDWKAMYQVKVAEIERRDRIIKALQAENLELKERVGKLQGVIRKMHGITSMLDTQSATVEARPQ